MVAIKITMYNGGQGKRASEREREIERGIESRQFAMFL